MTVTGSIRPIQPRDAPALSRLHRECYGQLSVLYGQTLDDQYLDRRVFSSRLWSTDCSLTYIGDQGELEAAVLANSRRCPGDDAMESLYLNHLVPGTGDPQAASALILALRRRAGTLGRSALITSLQWSGVWPGVVEGHKPVVSLCLDTGASLLPGELFLEFVVHEALESSRRALGSISKECRIRGYRDSDYLSLLAFLRSHFGIGWVHETLSKARPEFENFNGYGLASTYGPEELSVVDTPVGVQGFCVVQSVAGGQRGFFGPVGLAPALRGHGIGTALLVNALESLARDGKTHMGLWTSDPLFQGFYRRLGARCAFRTVHARWQAINAA